MPSLVVALAQVVVALLAACSFTAQPASSAATPSTTPNILNVNLTLYYFNYLMPVRLSDNKIRHLVVDTGNAQLTIVNKDLKISNRTTPATFRIPDQQCLMLTEDYQGIQFWRQIRQSAACSAYRGPVSIGNARAMVNFTVANNVTVDNPRLHPWTNKRYVEGDIGMAYVNMQPNTPPPLTQPPTPFRQILANETGNVTTRSQIFGLDLRAKNDSYGMAGDLQLGGVKALYKNQMAWYQQATDNPVYHEAFLSGLNVCGVSLVGGLGSSWPMLVDTGFACIGLPGALYDTLLAYLDLKNVPDKSALPALAFTLDGTPQTAFYIPLFSLLLDPWYFANYTGQGAPAVQMGGSNYRLCVLRGDDVGNTAAPRITLGTMALHSLYFAADYSTHRLGFSSKLSPEDYIDHQLNDLTRCLPPTTCIGSQSFDARSNKCVPPPCASYFFTYLDMDTQTCQYQPSALGAGMFFIITIISCEVLSFFVSQFSALEILHARERHSLAISKVDAVTMTIGRYMTASLDWILLKTGWARRA